MIVHLIAKQAFVGLDGEGARLYGGRWNSPGRPIVYTAANPSLAVLEVLVANVQFRFDPPAVSLVGTGADVGLTAAAECREMAQIRRG